MGAHKGRTPPRNAWKPGQSGNPLGRPPDPYADIYARITSGRKLDITITGEDGKEVRIKRDAGKGRTIKEALCAVTVAKALTGNATALEHVVNREVGAPIQRVETIGTNPMVEAIRALVEMHKK